MQTALLEASTDAHWQLLLTFQAKVLRRDYVWGCLNQHENEKEGCKLAELWCWRRFLRVPWTARRSNQSILKEICPEYSLGGRMLKLKLQSFGHLMRRTDSLEKTLMLGKTEGRRRRGWQEDDMFGWHHQLTGHEFWVDSGSWWWTGRPGVLQSVGSQRVGHDWVTELNWTES